MKLNALAAVIAATISTATLADLNPSSGRWHTLINDNGSLVAVGSNKYLEGGQAAEISEIATETSIDLPAPVVDMDASLIRSIAALDNGDVYLFGYRLSVQKVEGLSNATQVEVNDLGAYALVGGEVYFGWSHDFSTWSKIDGLSGITSISAKGKHMLAVDVNQAAHEVDSAHGATYVQGLPLVDKAIAGEFHSMFIDVNAQLWTMGEDSNGYGKLALGTTGGSATPQMVPNGDNVIDADGGKIQTIVAKADGTVWAAGWHNYISEDKATIYNKTSSLVQIVELSGVLDVEAGDDALFAATSDTMYSWGGALYGKLGTGNNTELHHPEAAYTSTYVPEPVIVPEIADVQPGGSYIITGNGFGDFAGTITMDGFVFDIKSWANAEVHIENPPVQMTGDLYLTTADGAISNSWYVTLETDAPSDTPIEDPVEECPLPVATLDRLHDLKEVRYLENLQFAWLPVPEKKATRKEHKALQKPVVAEIKVLRAELNALRAAGCPPKRHKYWRANGKEFNRFEFNHHERKAILKQARKEMRMAWKAEKASKRKNR